MATGRPTKLTPALQREIVRHLKRGNYREPVARFVGITERTFHGWMARGQAATEGVYHAFFQAVMKAEEEAEVLAVARVKNKHPEWWLERKYPERWARRGLIELPTGEGHLGSTTVIFQLISGTRPDGLAALTAHAEGAVSAAGDVPEAGRGHQFPETVRGHRSEHEVGEDVRLYGLDAAPGNGRPAG